jgi:hypothetical protein
MMNIFQWSERKVRKTIIPTLCLEQISCIWITTYYIFYINKKPEKAREGTG